MGSTQNFAGGFAPVKMHKTGCFVICKMLLYKRNLRKYGKIVYEMCECSFYFLDEFAVVVPARGRGLKFSECVAHINSDS